MTLGNGQVLQNRYRVDSLLAKGGMGAVYQAWDTRLSIPVALKEMFPQPGMEQEPLDQLRKQFQREAEVLARLHHPHLVRVTDFFEEGNNAYLVMDFVEGESLADRIKQQGALPEAQVMEWAYQLLDALAYCHAQGVLHRDVKPQNVIIRPDGQAMLVDFGLVKLWDPHDPRTRTAMRGMGTPEYAPPEQYDAEIGHTDPRSDIYSLGATLYHILTGQAPPTATMRIANPGVFRPPRAMNPHISPTMDSVVLRATELTVEKRFATTQEMAAAISSQVPATAPPGAPAFGPTKVIPGTQPATPSPPSYGPPQAIPGAQPVPEAQRRRRPVWAWLLGGLAVLVLGAGVAGVMLVRSGRLSLSMFSPTPTVQVEETVVAVAPTVVVGTATPTPSPSPSPTSTHTPTSTPTRKPTRTPRPTRTPTETLAGTPKGTPEGMPSPTLPATIPATPTTALTSGSPAGNPQPTSPPPSGALITFEEWVPWRRGDQPYGELTQTQTQVQTGRYAAKLHYAFPATTEDYVVFVRSLSLAGQPNAAGAWVYGDGSGHYLNIWIQDSQDEIWSVHLGRVGSPGWQQMAGYLDPNLSWPSGHLSGPENGVIDYPVRFHALVLDRPGSGPQSGDIYVDDISVWQSTTRPTATPPPAATAVPPTPRPAPTPTGEPPASADPLDFPVPTQVDGWEPIEGGHKATIIVHISGGVPPFIVYHDVDRFVTEKREFPIEFHVGGCAIIHSITVESADGQQVTHDYFIRAPGCD